MDPACMFKLGEKFSNCRGGDYPPCSYRAKTNCASLINKSPSAIIIF